MTDHITLILEDHQGNINETTCSRFAIVVGDKQLWVQDIDGQLFIGTDVAEEDTEYTNLIIRPMATNLISLQLETEEIPEGEFDDECCGDDACCCQD